MPGESWPKSAKERWCESEYLWRESISRSVLRLTLVRFPGYRSQAASHLAKSKSRVVTGCLPAAASKSRLLCLRPGIEGPELNSDGNIMTLHCAIIQVTELRARTKPELSVSLQLGTSGVAV